MYKVKISMKMVLITQWWRTDDRDAITVYKHLNAYNAKNMLLDASFLQFPSFDFSCLHFEVPYLTVESLTVLQGNI
jgi:hypothetical protein